MMPDSFSLSCIVTSRLPCGSTCAVGEKVWVLHVALLAGEGGCSDVAESIRKGCARCSMTLELTFCGQP